MFYESLYFYIFIISYIGVYCSDYNKFYSEFLKKILTLFCKRGKKHWMQHSFFVFCEYLCVDECISYMFMWAYGHVYSSVNLYVWRPETDVGCCSFLPFTLLPETQPRACRWVWDGSWWMNSGFSSVSVTPVLGAQLLRVFWCFVLRLSHMFYLILAVFKCPKLSW